MSEFEMAIQPTLLMYRSNRSIVMLYLKYEYEKKKNTVTLHVVEILSWDLKIQHPHRITHI